MVGASERGIIGAMHPARHLAHFAILGALLFAGQRWLAPPQPVAAPDVRAVARDMTDEELLAREARRLGLDRDDAVVRERLASNVAFAGRDDATPDERYREALALGMHESDALVQRRLAALMTARIRAEAAREPIDDATLRAWFDAHRDAYRQPAAVRLSLVCFVGEHAERRAHEASAEATTLEGDPCFFGDETPLLSEAELVRSYGAAFARVIFAAQPGAWTQPVASSQGWHLAFVRERVAARDADFAVVRDGVHDACVAERQDVALRAAVARLRAAQAAEPL
jgi:hypothetical protein